MRIQSTRNYTLKNNYSTKRKDEFQINNNISNPSFGYMYGVYGGGARTSTTSVSVRTLTWSSKKLNILTSTDSELRNLAEYFHNKSDDAIRSITSEAHNWSSTNAKNAADKLIKFVTPIRDNKAKMLNKANELEIKKGTGVSNVVGQKVRLNNEFISLIAAEKEGLRPNIKNGILIHGASKLKDEFISWLTESSGAVVKTIQHDVANPMKTISEIIKLAKDSEAAFNHSNTRTLIVVKDLDEMLIKPKNRDEVKLVSGFKSFAEDLSEKYHTTLIAKTDKNLDEFEPATIASNRLGVHVDLKDGISEDELKELGSLNSEVKRLDDKAAQVESKFKS